MKVFRNLVEEMMQASNFNNDYNETIQEILNFPKIRQFIEEHEGKISEEMVTNSFSKLNEYMLAMKTVAQGKEGSNPGFLPELVLSDDYIDVTYIPTKAYYEAQRLRKEQQLLNNRMMSKDVRDAQLQQYDVSTPERVVLMNEVVQFIEHYQHTPLQAQGLFITGPFGVGKTYLLGALANYLVKLDISVTMLHYPTFVTEIRKTVANGTTTEWLEPIKNVNILMLDDVGAETNTPWIRDDVLSIILEYRMKEMLPTFFTSNFNMQEFEIHLADTKEGRDLLKAKRIMERVHFFAKEVQLNGVNRRRMNRQHYVEEGENVSKY